MAAKPGGSGRPRSAELREELVRELRHLRVLVREIGENFILRQEGEVEAAIGSLEALPGARLRAIAPGLLQDLRKLKVKPAKGRFKDLKELNRLIAEATGQAASAEAPGKKGAGRK